MVTRSLRENRKCRAGTQIAEVFRQSRARRRHCEGRVWSLCSLHCTGLICVSNEHGKSYGCHCTTARLWWTSSWRRISIPSGKNGRCSKIIENSQVRCVTRTPTAHTFFLMRILSACLSQTVVTVVQEHTATRSRTDPTHRVAQGNTEHIVSVLHPKQSHFIAQSHVLHLTWLHRARALLPSSTYLPHMSYILLSGSINPAETYCHISVALWLSPTLHRLWVQAACWKSGSQAFHRRQAVYWTRGFTCQTLSFHLPITASTYDSAESIATPLPDSDLDDEQLRALLASQLYLQEREANAGRSQVYHSERENLMSISSQDPTSTGRLVALFSSKKESRNVSRKRRFSFETSTSFWEQRTFLQVL